MAPTEDPNNKYELRHQIGRGSFGSAFLVTHKCDKTDYVLKRVRLAKQTRWQRNSTMQERDLASALRHPFIVPCVESWVVQNHTVNMIYAFCSNGDLAGYLARARKQGASVDEALLHKWLAQLLLALDYLQSQGVLHRDIKTSNLMLTAEDDVQLGDFGLATLMTHTDDEGSKPQDTNLVGTPHYMSPELLSCKSYGFKTDVWSLGCVFYELTAQRPTFNAFNIHGLVSKIKKNKLAPLPEGYSEEWRDIVHLMLCKNPERRPSVQQLMGLPALRPAMLEARARARELMPGVALPPLLDPTPLTPLPLGQLGHSFTSCGSHDVDEGEAGSGGARCSSSDQAGVSGRSPRTGCGSEGGGCSRAASSRAAAAGACGGECWGTSPGLPAQQALGTDELAELWRASYKQLQEEAQQLDEQLDDRHVHPDTLLSEQLAALELGLTQQRGASPEGAGHAAAGGAQERAGSSTPPKGGSAAGALQLPSYSPRTASANGGVIHGYKRITTVQAHQPGIKATPSRRVAAAIAAADGSKRAHSAAGLRQPSEGAAAPRSARGAGSRPTAASSNGGSSRRSVTPSRSATPSARSVTPSRRAGSSNGSTTPTPDASGSTTPLSLLSPRDGKAAGGGSSSSRTSSLARKSAPLQAGAKPQRPPWSGGGSNLAAPQAATPPSTAAAASAVKHVAAKVDTGRHANSSRQGEAGGGTQYLQMLEREHTRAAQAAAGAADGSRQQRRRTAGPSSGGADARQQQQQQQRSPAGLPLLQPLLQQQLLPPQDAAGRQEEQGDITPPALPLETSSGYFSLEQEGSPIGQLHFSGPGQQQLVPLLPLFAEDLQAASAAAPTAAAFHSSCRGGGNPVVLGSPIQVAAASPVQRDRQQQQRQPVSEAGGRPQLALAARQQAGSSSLRLDAGLREGGDSLDGSAGNAQKAGSSAGLGAQEQQRLQLLESALLVIGGLAARGCWTELQSVISTPGLLPEGQLRPLAALAARRASSSSDAGVPLPAAEQQQQQLSLGDIVVLGRSKSIKGKIRYLGPVAWDPCPDSEWVGMELDRPCGIDATQRGICYFSCAPKCASFHRAAELTSFNGGGGGGGR